MVITCSTATLHLTVNKSTTSTQTTAACNSYTWNGTAYTTSGTYTRTFTGGNNVGCDSTATLYLTINKSTTGSQTISACNTYTWNGTAYSATGTYTHTFTGGNNVGCDSIATLHLTVNKSSTSTQTTVACNTYTWNGTAYTASGTYTRTFTAGNKKGCDSTATLHLTVNYSTTSTQTTTACNTYTWNGTAYTTSGTYTRTFTAGNKKGCDSTATLYLTVNSSSTGTQTTTACNSYTWNGTAYSATGTYTHTFTGGNNVGCDSTATLHLTVNKSTSSTQTIAACNSYTWNGTAYTTSGTYTRPFTGGNNMGCDSTATLHLTVNKSTASTQTITACNSYTWNGAAYTTSGTYTRTFTGGNKKGCDSTATLNLTVNNSTTGTQTVTACNTFTWNGTTHTTSGTYTHTFTGGNNVGCDSTATLFLTINKSTTSTQTTTACNSYIWNGTTYAATGTYTHTFTGGNNMGCDSVVTLYLTVNKSSTSTQTLTVCNTYTWNGTAYTTSGTYTRTFTGGNKKGCDSIATLHLTVNSSTASTQTTTACNTYTWNGAAYTTSGTYTRTFTAGNKKGCDSTATLYLTINKSSTGTQTTTACNSYTWNGTAYTTSGTYTHTFTGGNNAGCDSTATLYLTVNKSTTSTQTTAACNSYTWNGTAYTTSGTYTRTFTGGNNMGCDSTATLHLTVNKSTASTQTITACNSYTWNGTAYTTSGTYTRTFTAGNKKGCDSTATLYLTVNKSSTSTLSATACNSYTWNGTTHTTSGTYTHTFTGGNNAGCDSTATLYLTVNKSTTSTQTTAACNSYTWNGTAYTTSGTYTRTFTGGNNMGCDSTATLHLTVNKSTASTQTTTACNSYTWNGTAYTTSGTHTRTFTAGNKKGCDSTATLYLTVNSSSTGTQTTTACNSYTWNGTTHTTSGTYTHTFTGGNNAGCDSTATLYLTVNKSSTGTQTTTACNSYMWNGKSYTASGTYTHTFTGGNNMGCDSTATLYLTVNTSPIITAGPYNQTVCSGNSVSFTVTATGTGLTYQWRKGNINLYNGSGISGATSSTLTINPVSISDTAYNYNVIVYGICGPNDTSANVNLYVNTPPVITYGPVNQTVCLGNKASFSVTAGGTGLKYQWRKGNINLTNGSGVSGVNTSTLTINPVAISDTAYNYNVIVSGTCAPNDTSNNASLTVNTPLVLIGNVKNQTVCSGNAVSFTVNTTGTGLTYQWRKGNINLSNGSGISGATSSTLTINPVSISDTAYDYNVIISSPCSPNDTSNYASLFVNTPPMIYGGPYNQSVCNGSVLSFWVTATGTNLTYQWRKGKTNLKNGGRVSGANTSILTINPVLLSDTASDYNVIISGLCSPNDTSANVYLKICGFSSSVAPEIVVNYTNNAVILYPNPFRTSLNIKLNDALLIGRCEVRIFNILGTEVMSKALTEQVSTLETDNLASGMYIYNIVSNNIIIQSGKLINQ